MLSRPHEYGIKLGVYYFIDAELDEIPAELHGRSLAKLFGLDNETLKVLLQESCELDLKGCKPATLQKKLVQPEDGVPLIVHKQSAKRILTSGRQACAWAGHGAGWTWLARWRGMGTRAGRRGEPQALTHPPLQSSSGGGRRRLIILASRLRLRLA